MKKTVLFFAIIIVVATTIICSCKKSPSSSASCIEISLSSAAATDSQTVGVDSAITPIKYSILTNVVADSNIIDTLNINVSGTLPPGVTGHFSKGIFTISGTPTTSVGSPFKYIVTTTGNSCNNIVIKGSITVINTACPTINLSSAYSTISQTVNVNNAISQITYELGGATGAVITGLPPGITGIFSGEIFRISGTPNTSLGSPFTYTITTVGSTCTSTATGIIAVNPLPTSTVTVPANVTVCNGSTVAATAFASTPSGATFTWTNSSSAIGLPSSGTGDIASFTAMNTTELPITATITVTPTTGLGIGASSLYTIKVNPTPTITLTSGSTSQTISNGTSITSIVYTLGGSATGVSTITDSSAGQSGSLVGDIYTINATPTSPGDYMYMITATDGACISSSLTGTIVTTP
jgi:hypothetical protein